MTTSLMERFALLVGRDPLFRPRRIVTRSGARVRGIFPSHRFSRALHWESALERALIYRLECSWLVVDACTQPTTVSVPSADGTRFRLHTRRACPGCHRATHLHRVQTTASPFEFRTPCSVDRHQKLPPPARGAFCDRDRGHPCVGGMSSKHTPASTGPQRRGHSQPQFGHPQAASGRTSEHLRRACSPFRLPNQSVGTGLRPGVFRRAFGPLLKHSADVHAQGEV